MPIIFWVLAAVGSAAGGVCVATDDPPVTSQSAAPAMAEVEPTEPTEPTIPAKRTVLPAPPSGSRRVAGLPEYVKVLSSRPAAGPQWDWLLYGLEQRTRFEYRSDEYRANLLSDSRFLLRTRGFVGVQRALDPVRFGFEFQDARGFGSSLPPTDRDINEADILQAWVELYFAETFGTDQPLRLQVGRLSFDAIDRRLIARNNFRNTTNAFDGVRIRWGEQTDPLEIDVFGMQPVERRLWSALDPPTSGTWLYGVTAYWRQLAPWIVLEPYYIVLDADRTDPELDDREIHTLGVHGFGYIGESGLDYDFDVAWQLGNVGARRQRAFASHGEIGYTLPHEWKPRLAGMVNYATGDQDPDDDLMERFDPLYGATFTFYGFNQYFSWQNMINPAIQFSVRPHRKLAVETFYRAFWLAADADGFGVARLRDRAGDSGNFAGQEIDLRVRYSAWEWAEFEAGYAHFFPGSFTSRVGEEFDDSDLFYVQVTVSL